MTREGATRSASPPRWRHLSRARLHLPRARLHLPRARLHLPQSRLHLPRARLPPFTLLHQVHAAPRQDEVGRIDEFIQWTLYGIKTDTARPPYKSLQVGGDPQTGCQSDTPPDGVDCDGIRMTLYYYGMECDIHTYNGTLPPRNWSVEYLKTRSPSSSPIPPPWLLAPTLTPTRTLTPGLATGHGSTPR